MQRRPFTTFRAAAVLALAFAAACSDPFSGGRLPVRFTVTERPPAGDPEFTAASTVPRIVTINGAFGYSPCDAPKPRASVDGQLLVFRLEMEPTGGTCPSILTLGGYRAEISGVSAGTYHLRVEHVGTYDNGANRTDGVRFETEVTVQ